MYSIRAMNIRQILCSVMKKTIQMAKEMTDLMVASMISPKTVISTIITITRLLIVLRQCIFHIFPQSENLINFANFLLN